MVRSFFPKRHTDEFEETGGEDFVEENHELEELHDVLRRAAMGDLDVRVTGIGESSALAALATDLNRLLDMTESFTRETGSTLSAAREGRPYRKFLMRGMLGDFALGAQEVNAATETVAAASALLEQNQAAQQDAQAHGAPTEDAPTSPRNDDSEGIEPVDGSTPR